MSTGGAAFMEHKRDADRLYEVHGRPRTSSRARSMAVATSPRGTAPIDGV